MKTNTDCRAINIFNSTNEQDKLTITGKTSIDIDTAPTEDANYSTNWLEAIRSLGGTVNLNGGTHISMDITGEEQSPLLSDYYIAGILALSTDENAILYEDYIEPPDFNTKINLKGESTIDGITVKTSSQYFVSSAALEASGTKASINVDGSMVIRDMTTQNTQGDAYTYGVYTENGAQITFNDALSISNLKATSLSNNHTEAFALVSYGGGISVPPSDKDIIIVGETGAFSQEETDIPNINVRFNTANSSLTGIAMLREPDWINGGLKDDGGIIDFSFAPGATWNVIPADSSTVSNYLHQEDELLFSEVTSLNLDTGANVYLGSMKSSWDFLPQGFTTSPFGTTSDMASTPVQLRTKELNGNGNFYLRTDLHQDISDSVLITESLSGSHTLHVKGGGSGDLIKEQTNSYLARTEFVNDGLGNEFSLAKNSHGQELVDLGVYNYRLNHSQRNNGREWYLVRENAPVEPGTPAGPDTDSFSPTGEAEAALSGLAGHYAMWYGYQTDLRKRLGEVRYGTQTGLWVRGFADKARLDGLAGTSFTQNLVGGSIGYDTLADVDETYMWILGMQIRSGHADQSTNGRWGGYGDLTSVGGGLYSTWVHVDGWYLDAVATMDWYNHEIRAAMLDGTPVHDDRSSYGIGASLEGGRKMDFAFSNEGRDYWFLEPQLQLSWFWVRGGSFTSSNGMTIDQSDMASLTGRAGLVLGKKFTLDEKDGPRYVQPYVKAGVNHEFLGEQRARLNGLDMRSDLDGTRVYYGLGVDWQLSDDIRLYMQAEREHGENFTREYNMSAGLKWRF